MTIDEVKAAKAAAEQEIAKALTQFEKETGTIIRAVNCDVLHVGSPEGATPSWAVLIDVRL
jgi:hypothetical protein